MKVSNVREGLATNSSSTHSIIISSQLNNKVKDLCNDDFGWDYFVAYKPENKLRYLGILLSEQLKNDVNSDIIAKVVSSKWLNAEPFGSIDHQSIFRFPLTYGTDTVDKQFFEDFKNFILRPDVVICGGNDNDDSGHPLLNNIEYKNLSALIPFLRSYTSYWCRKDGEHWTVFDKKNLRYTFSYDDFIKPIIKYTTPLLVDLKITDYCLTNCNFCYQSSTKEGKHAPFDTVKSVLDALAKLKVFEVAIGGGNPVAHPNFIEILEYAKSVGIVPNFSTRDLSFIKKGEDLKRISNACGNFAYSLDPGTDLSKLSKIIDKLSKSRDYAYPPLMSFQLFIGPGGFVTYKDLVPVLKLAHKRHRVVTLLGYKHVGRGASANNEWPIDAEYPPLLIDTLFKLKASNNCPSIGMDTVLAKELSPSLVEAGISTKLFVLEEGKSSCYIDAVTNIISPSSFSPNKLSINITDANKIKEAFSTF